MSGIFDQVINYAPPSLLKGTVTYKGTWSAATNTPTLINPPDSTTNGHYYVVSAGGTQFSLVFNIGDWIISNGSAWEKVDNTDAVSSVFGRTGAVVGVSTDYSSVGITNTALGASNPSTVAATTITASSTIAATGAVTGSNLSGTNTGNQTITLTGGVTGSGTGSFAATVVTNANLTGGVTSIGNAATVVTNANLTGDVTSVGNATTLTNAPVIAKVLTGYTSGAGTVAATDSILQAIQKLNGNNATNANLTGVITSVGNATSIASQTGTGTKFVVDTSPVLVTPNIGIATGTSLAAALNGTLGATTPSSVAATTGTFSSTLGVTGVATLGNGAILGTPASGTVTNLTGTASININGTVGATTPSTVAATTLGVSYASNLTGRVTTGGGFTATATVPTVVAASANFDYNSTGSKGRIFVWGNDTSNVGQLEVNLAKSDGSSAVAPFLLSSTGLAVTGTLSATGTSTLVAINSSGVIANSSNNGQPFRATGATTGESVLSMTNTGGSAIFGQENSAGNYLIGGSTAYDTVVRGPSGIAFSANAGNAMQMRISSAGAAITGTLSTTGNTDIGGILKAQAGTANTTANIATYGVSVSFDNNTEVGWIQSIAGAASYRTLQLNPLGGTVTTGAALTVGGALSKASGSFRIEHPLPSKSATHQLVHSFIEGPKCDLIYRGKVDLVDGKASVNIDADSTMTEGTFEVLCATVQCFTSNESGWGAIRGKVIGNILTIEAQDAASTDNVSWMVIGERKDKHIMDTEWTDENGRPIVEPLKPAEPALEAK